MGKVARLPARASARGPIAVPISDDPEVRIAQSASFWRRNPGYADVGSFGDLIRGVLALVPGLDRIAGYITPTQYGYGQPMIDQMRWQIRSGRQPGNPWWMRMNASLVGAGLEAEAYLRAGRSGELTRPDHQSWLAYLTLGDHIKRLLGRTPGANYTTPASVDDRSRALPDGALSDGWRSVGLLARLEVLLVWRPVVRRQYWVAHDETIQAGKSLSNSLLREYQRTNPREAAFGSAWAHTIKLFRHTNPIAAGHAAAWFNNVFLPQTQPLDQGQPSLLQRAFVRLITALDPSFPPR